MPSPPRQLIVPHPSPSPESVFANLRSEPGAVWLDNGHEADGWSILTCRPSKTLTTSEQWPTAARALTTAQPRHSPVPFASGVIGYISYEAGAEVLPIPRHASSWEPEIWLNRYEGALCYHHATARWFVSGPPELTHLLEGAVASALPLSPPPIPSARTTASSVTESWYTDRVQRTLDWIADGDCYQLNLTRAVVLQEVDPPWEVYRRLRELSAPGFGAYLAVRPDLTILSNSPESFLSFDGEHVSTTPIKGTRPRATTPDDDRRALETLRDSPKERAELTMIVDLCRNDLGMTAVPGSVHVSPRVLTSHANVHHAAQTIRATIAPEHDLWDTLAASFPPGSVTGAPKIRACQRIFELEETPRGVYCGAIGFVSDHGQSRWSVAIRTAVIEGKRARYHLGSGIVADSHPKEEWEETSHKGTILAKAFTGSPTPDLQ